MKKSVLIGLALLLMSSGPGSAAESVTIEKLQAQPQSYHLKSVILKGTVHQLQPLGESLLPPPYVQAPLTFILSDETGFLQITLADRGMCGRGPCPPLILKLADNDAVELLARVLVEPSDMPGNLKPRVLVTAEEIRRLGEEIP